ncbi:MAG: GDSL-type esterase/lipase family protein [Bacteroidales bacterium]|nr:GDSL-type esterase/lipase family protein [Bacteroidales bacterium]
MKNTILKITAFAVLSACFSPLVAQNLEEKAETAINNVNSGKYTDYYYKRVAGFSTERPVSDNDIVFLGNSLVEGGKWSSYFPRTERKLEKRGGSIRNRGIIGDTADGISDRLYQILPGHPRKIFLITGANDVSHDLSVDSVVAVIRNLIEKIKSGSPKTKIYLQSLLPINESFHRYRRLNGKTWMFPTINAKLAELAKEEGVKFINIYPLFLAEKDGDTLEPSITRDGLHVNARGYEIWSDAIRRYVR